MLEIFTTEDCPNCIAIKEKLKGKNIEFKESTGQDLISNKDLLAELAYHNVDFTSMPLIILDNGSVMDYEEANKWMDRD